MWAALVLFLISIAAQVLDMVLFSGMVAKTGGSGPVSLIFSLATLLPSIGLGVRRLHDIGRSGWWVLIALTVIGIVLLIYWYAQPGQRQDNKFGPDVEAGK